MYHQHQPDRIDILIRRARTLLDFNLPKEEVLTILVDTGEDPGEAFNALAAAIVLQLDEIV